MRDFKPENTLISKDAPKEIPIDTDYAHPNWITDSRRYWISRATAGGYWTNYQGKNDSGQWCYSFTYDGKPPAKTLKGAIKRIESLIAYHKPKQQQGHIS